MNTTLKVNVEMDDGEKETYCLIDMEVIPEQLCDTLVNAEKLT